MQADANLDPDDRISVGVYDFDGFRRRHQAEIATFADHDAAGEAIDAGKRHVEEREHPDWQEGRITCSRKPG